MIIRNFSDFNNSFIFFLYIIYREIRSVKYRKIKETNGIPAVAWYVLGNAEDTIKKKALVFACYIRQTGLPSNPNNGSITVHLHAVVWRHKFHLVND